MAEAITIKDGRQLHDWLRDKPREWADDLELRAVLRVLPLVLEIFRASDDEFEPVIKKHIVLAAFRSGVTVWAAQVLPESVPARVLLSAVEFAASAITRPISPTGAAYTTARVALGAISNAAFQFAKSSESNTYGSDSAAEAARIGSIYEGQSDIWESIRADVDWIVNNPSQSLIAKPLWLNDVQRDDDSQVNVPVWAWRPFHSFKESILAVNQAWGVWLDWYQAILAGGDDGPSDMALVVSTQPAEFWGRDPDKVTADVANLAAWRPQSPGGAEQSRQKRPSVEPEASIVAEVKADDQGEVQSGSNLASKTELAFLSDAHDPAVDYLDRTRLAFVLAARLNQVWDSMNEASASTAKGSDAQQEYDRLQTGFVVHIDAPWGGGKTSFSEFLAILLNPYRYSGPLPSWMDELHIDDPAYWPESYRRPWHIVNFNAWRHQHVKPPWWVFAESIRNCCAKAALHELNQKSGVLPVPTSKFSYRSSVGRKLHGAFNWGAEQAWRVWTPDFRTRFIIALLASGLLALLFGYGVVSVGDKGALKADSSSPVWLAPLVLLLGGAPAVWTFLTALTQTLLPGTPEAAQNYALGAGDPLDRFRRHFSKTMHRYHRPVLVVVDDLDRCDPAYVTELLRGMQTILVSQRVVFLLLGDRDWLEQAFSETYKAMKGIYVGPEHEFGARFIEKAIQFSFVLPDVSKVRRLAYVRRLLKLDDKPAGAASESQPLKEAAEAVLSKENYADREAAAATLRRSDAVRGLDRSTKEKILEDLDVKLSLRAAADPSAERATGHMIEALAPLLPSNPRQIKRIVNALSLMQEAARLQNMARPGSPEWQVLARWIVIMTEWPKSFYTLSRYPGLADKVLNLKESSDLPEKDAEKFADAIKSNKPVMDLMTFADPAKGWLKRDISGSEIGWLRTLIPPASGRFLDIGSGSTTK